MSIENRPLTETPIRQLYELACTPFTLASFRERWAAFGWSYEPSASDQFGFQVEVLGTWPLIVDPLGGDVIGASLPFCYWDDCDPEAHDDLAEYSRQRREYDEAFETAANSARRLLPGSMKPWTDATEDSHKAIVWEGDYGLLILQQACYDPQFGIEVDFWLTNCTRQDFQPTTPLIDWLCKRSRDIRAGQDLPPSRR